MELPIKRINPGRSRPVENPQKKPKISSNKKSYLPSPKAICLRKDLWIEILDFLDTIPYFRVIPQINSFFYSLVKESENYRTNLSLHMKVDYKLSYNTTNCIISKDNKCLNLILKSKLLKKLDLKLKYDDASLNKKKRPRLLLSDYFVSMKSLKTLKILKIHTRGMIFIENFLNLFDGLEVLKVNYWVNFIYGYNFIKNKYLKNYTCTSNQSTHLKKLSLIYTDVLFKLNYAKEIFQSLDKNTGLEKFSIKTLAENNLVIEFSSFLKTNCNLKCLKLPNYFIFNKTSAEDLCNYLAKSKIIEELQINDSIMICSQLFFESILINRSLRILYLLHSFITKKIEFEINLEDSFKLLNTLAHSLIENFSVFIFANGCKKISNQQINPGENNLIEKFLESLDYFLSMSEKINKIAITIFNLSDDYALSIANLIVKHVKLGKIECFAGYNLKMLRENKIEILELGKSEILYIYNSLMNTIMIEILRIFLVDAVKINKIIDRSKSLKDITNVKDFLQTIAKSRSLVLNLFSKKLTIEFFSQLHFYSIIILTTRIKEISKIDIRCADLELHIEIISELLKEFKSLNTLKFTIISH